MKNRSCWSRTAAAVCAFILVQWIPASALAQATVTTDREDYAPFSDVVITGRGFGTNEAVTVRIDELFAGGLETFVAEWSDTTTDDSGNFTTIWYIWGDDFIGSTLRATATGQSSGVSARTVFTDGPPPTGIAPVIPPVGGFGIDGDLKANATSGDWLAGPAGSQGAVLNNDGSAVDSTTTFHITDPYDGDDDVFGGGDKVNADPNTWGWTRKPGGAGNKVDLNNALVHLTTNPGNHHQWVVVSGDRMSDNGTAYIDFEFLQNTLTLTNNTGGTNGGFASAGPHGGRTVNDFILTVALVNGGSTASFYLVQWKPKPGGGYDYFDATANLPIGSWFAAVNPTNGTPVPYGAFGTNIYLKNTFAEAAVDMTALLGAITSDPCIGMQVKTVLVKTKESDSTSANIADLINPIQINLKLGLADAGSGQAQCADPSGTTTFNLTGTAHPNINAVTNMSWSVVSGNATITSGNACNNCTTLPATVAVTGAPATATLRLTIKDAAGCTQTDEVTLTVKPLPPCEITGPNGPLCPNSTDRTYTGPSGMDTYSWTISGGGTIVGANTGPSVRVKASANCNTDFTLALTVTKDGCSSLSGCNKTVAVKDTTAPLPLATPADVSVQCSADVPSPVDLTASDTCSGSITVSPVDSAPVADAQGCGYTITRTWTFTDNCGNSSSASQSIHVKDTIAPVTPDAPAAANVQCGGDIPAAVQLTAQDNCSGSITVSPVEGAPVPDAQGCGYTITRTWTFADACGNRSSASQSIHVKDTTAPVAPDAPAAANVQCAGEIPAAGQLTAQDNCSGSITVSPVEGAPVPDAQGCGHTIMRTWTFTDNCGNRSSVSQSIHVKDTIAPVAPDAPAAANVQCAGDIPAAVQLTAQDNCSGSITVSPVDDAPAADAQGCGYTITRTWNFTDACGNSSSASQSIHVKDTIAPVAPDAPAAANVQCAGDIPAAVQLTAQDNCSGSIAVSPVDGAPAADAQGCGYTITRTWTFTDHCGNSSSASQSFHVKDTTTPVAPDAPAAANVQCAGDIPAGVQLTAQDNCSGSITVSPVEGAPVPDAQGCGYTITRTWTFTDNCGNSSSVTQSIYVKDTTAPVAPNAPAAANVQCAGDIPAAVQLTAQDNCSGSITVSPVDGAPVADAQGCGYTITRTWNFTDACGNSSSASQSIHVKDTIAPVVPDAPAAANVQCAGEIPAAVQLTAQDNCSGSITVSPVDSAPVPDAQGCGYTITRTWTFTDNCGNSSSVSQSIYVKDTTAPVATDAPAAANVQCAGDIPAAVQLTAQDNCSGSITVSPVEGAPVPDAQGCGHTITRTWTFTDNCGNSSSASQSIHVKDTIAPVAPDAPAAANVQCAGDIPAAVQLTAQDNCSGSITVSPVEGAPVPDAQVCGHTITRTWTFTDNCGNSSSVSQSIHVKDTIAPLAPDAPAAANVQCAGDIPAAVQLTAQDNCSGSITVWPVDSARVADAQGCGYTITRTWTFTDNCGNSSGASQSIHVKDTTAPVAPDAPAAANVQCAGDIPAAVQLTAQDNCSGSITVSPVDSAPVADAQGCGYTLTRTWTFTDNCGNSSSASQSIHVKDTTAPVAPDAPAAANVQCAGDIPAAVQLTAQDNCSGSITVSPVDGAPVADAQGCGYTITRTWTFTDKCGNSSSVSQSIYVKDTIAPVAPDAPAAANVQCEGGGPAALQLTAQDNCSGSITVSPVDSAPVPDAQGCGATFERTWTFTDACGNSSSVSQSIHVKELSVLVAPDAPAAANVQCEGDMPAPVQLTAQDNCTGSITVSPVDSAPVADAQGCGYTITRTWTFTDNCGNSSSASQSIHVKDTIAPVAPDAPAAANVQCAGEIPAAVRLTAQDNCSGSITVSPEDSAPVPDAQGCGYTITRTWTFTDACGNSSSASQSIHVKDTTAPVAPDAPAAANVQCAGDIPAAVQLTAQDNCSGSISVSPVDSAPVADAQGCGYTITRTWTFTDNCGNSSSASQSIHVKDTTAPVAPDAPAAANVQCAGDIPAAVQLTAQDNCSGSITVSPVEGAPVPDAQGCGHTITRTWTFTDNCGNSSSASQSIHVKDTIAPVAPDAPAAANVQCAGDIPAAVPLTAQDNCSGSITVSPVDGAPVPDAQGCGNTITRTWTFTDNCGNSSSVSQSIYVKDTIAPVAPDAPAAANVQCEGGVPAALQLTAQDNCSGSITVSPVDSAPVPDAQGCGATFERTWTFTDACGNSSSVSQSIHVKELIVLVAPDAPAAANVQCTGDIPAAVQLTAQNNCSGSITVSPVDSAPVPDAQGCGYTITRTWTFTDACGNSSSASQSIHVKDTTAPVAPDAPAAANVQCAGDIPAALQLTAQDNCSGSISVSPVDSAPVADAQGCGYTITRTWTFTDNCGNSSSASQSIHVKDTTAPVAPDAPAAANVQCAGDIPAAVQLTAQDNCSGSITVSPVEGAPAADAQGCGHTITRTWTFTDNCGNSSSASQSIHVKDTIAPVAPDAPAAANVQCTGDIPAAVQLTAQDNCSGSITVSPVDGAPVADAQGCGNTITRTWTFTDNCGNSSSVSQSIYVKDTIAPVAPDAPAAANVQCEGGVPAALQLTAQDNCSGSITVSPVDSAPVPDAQGCGATFERTWTFTDACGNSSSVSQSIHVKELIVLVAPDAPAAANVQCTGDIPAAVQLTAQNNCSGSITVSPVDSAPVTDAQGCGYTITRTWTFTDACGNSSSASQSIHVKDTTAPVAPDAPAAANAQCDGDMPARVPLTAQDNCSGSITVWPVDSERVADAQGCGYTITRTWTFTDACGNSSSASQSIHVKDTTAPVAPVAPAAANAQCDGDMPARVPLTAQDNCSGSITVWPVDSERVADAQGCGYTITRTWTFADACGNRSSTSQSIHVKDTIAPVAPNAPAAANVQCAGDIPTAVQLTAQDNCSGSITVLPVDSAPVADAQGCGYTFTRTWTFTDACGNSSSASQNIVFADTQAPILMSYSASAVIECSATPQFTTPVFWDHCDSNPAVTQTDSTSTDALGQTVYTRTWTCTDACSNSTTCAQSLTAATCGGNVCVVKFFDANTDGIQNNGELGIAGWKFTLTGGPTNITLVGYTGNDGSFCFPTVGPGTYTVTEATAKQSSWFNTTPKSCVVTVAGSAVTKQFGNVCIGWGGADGTPGFWSNKNGETLLNDGPDGANPELTMLASLYLRNAKGGNFDPKKYADFKTWLQGADAVNAAYALSKHLAAMELNVEARMRNGNALIYAPGAVGANAQGFATLNTLMNEANTLLGKKGSIPSGDSDRAYALALKDALANGNVSSNFVQASACPFTF